MRTTHVLLVASLAGTLLACGQKGPLVLPDAQHPHKKIGIAKPPAGSAPAASAPTSSPASAPSAPPGDASATGEAQTRTPPAPAPQP